MPQDRVQDFAKMNAQEILKNTQSSVCSAEMSETFDKLIEKRAKQLESSKVSQDSMTKLLEAEQRNEELKGAIESMKERQSYTKKLEICLKKKAWMEYEIGYEKFKETETDLKQAKKETAKATEKLKPLQNRIDALKRTKEGLDKAVSQESQTLRVCSGKVDDIDEGMEKFEDQIKRAQSDLKVSVFFYFWFSVFNIFPIYFKGCIINSSRPRVRSPRGSYIFCCFG
jgi:structural maintenance of chromosomes protein 5